MIINSTLCYISRGHEYLLLHRVKKKNDLNHDKWIGFGGKFLDKESPEECVLREVKEETGLTLTSYRYRGVLTFVSDIWDTEIIHLFTADDFTGELTECSEGVAEWIDKDVYRSMPMWEGDVLFLDLLEKDEPFFSMKLSYEGDTLVYAALNGQTIIDRKKE